jgi:hypothetical protein
MRSIFVEKTEDGLESIHTHRSQEYGASAADADALSCAMRLGSGMEKTLGAVEWATWRIDDLAARAGELGYSRLVVNSGIRLQESGRRQWAKPRPSNPLQVAASPYSIALDPLLLLLLLTPNLSVRYTDGKFCSMRHV